MERMITCRRGLVASGREGRIRGWKTGSVAIRNPRSIRRMQAAGRLTERGLARGSAPVPGRWPPQKGGPCLGFTRHEGDMILSDVTCFSVRLAGRSLRVRPGLRPRRQHLL